MAATPALRKALDHGISSGDFIDTKVILYSHRDPSGRVYRPKALYANSDVLKTVPYFNDRESTITITFGIGRTGPHGVVLEVLFGNFAESKSKDFNEEEINEEESAEDYGYSSDSDLEDDEDEWVHWFTVPSFDLFWFLRDDGRSLYGQREERVERGKVVKIPDMAFVT